MQWVATNSTSITADTAQGFVWAMPRLRHPSCGDLRHPSLESLSQDQDHWPELIVSDLIHWFHPKIPKDFDASLGSHRENNDTQVLSTPYLRTYSVFVGFTATPALDPISEHEARSAQSTISSLGSSVVLMLFPSPESVCPSRPVTVDDRGMKETRRADKKRLKTVRASNIEAITASKEWCVRYSIRILNASSVWMDCRRSTDTAGEPATPIDEGAVLERRLVDDADSVARTEHVVQLDLGWGATASPGTSKHLAAIRQPGQIRVADDPLRDVVVVDGDLRSVRVCVHHVLLGCLAVLLEKSLAASASYPSNSPGSIPLVCASALVLRSTSPTALTIIRI